MYAAEAVHARAQRRRRPPLVRGHAESSDPTNDATGAESFMVHGAGSPHVNGVYEYDGEHDGARKYTKMTEHGQSQSTLTLYRCTLASGVKRWYISDVYSDAPGTSADVDYYWAGKDVILPPTPPCDGWVTCKSVNSAE